MNIEKHICDLLFRYECVIIPGFGGLITSHCSAMMQNDEHLFYPPSKFIAFNKNLNKQDGLLANYISEKEKISYLESVSQIDQFAKSITSQLQKGKKVVLANIGIFHTDKEKNILFTPDDQMNYLTASFGLSNFYASPINREEEIQKENKRSNGIVRRLFPTRVKSYHLAFAASIALFASVWLPFNNNKIESRHIDYSNLNTFGQIQKPIIKAEALFTEYNPFAKQENIDSASKLSVHVVELAEASLHSEETVIMTNVTDTKIADAVAEVPQEINKEKIASTLRANNPVVTLSANQHYYIIAGVFAQKENAEKMVRILNTEGFANALIVDKNKKGHYRVAFDSFEEQSSAENSLAEIKLSQKKSAWLLSK